MKIEKRTSKNRFSTKVPRSTTMMSWNCRHIDFEILDKSGFKPKQHP